MPDLVSNFVRVDANTYYEIVGDEVTVFHSENLTVPFSLERELKKLGLVIDYSKLASPPEKVLVGVRVDRIVVPVKKSAK